MLSNLAIAVLCVLLACAIAFPVLVAIAAMEHRARDRRKAEAVRLANSNDHTMKIEIRG